MIQYLINSAICMSSLLFVYHLFLEKEKMLQFNRFYLLGGLLFSLAAPLMIVKTVIVNATGIMPVNTTAIVAAQLQQETPSPLFELSSVVSFIYVIIASTLILRALINIVQLLLKAKRSIREVDDNRQLVLIDNPIVPHTFGHLIFLNKSDYRNGLISPMILEHEYVHARQLHTVDILIVEVVLALNWFNPLIYLFKRAIQLNHEFIADNQVIKTYKQVNTYQHLLIDSAVINRRLPLVSQLNYSVTKKRLHMMTKTTNKLQAIFKGLCCLPIFILLLSATGKTSYAQESTPSVKKQVDKNDVEDYFKNATFHWTTKDGNKIVKLYRDLTAEEKSQLRIPPPPPVAPGGQSPATHEPLPEGTVVELTNNGSIMINWNGKDAIAPPPPPVAPRVVKGAPKPPGTPPPPPAAPPAPPKVIKGAPQAPGTIPPPPPPLAPDKYIEKMVDKGASFMLNGKTITGEKALEIARSNNKKLSIKTVGENGKTVVKLKDN